MASRFRLLVHAGAPSSKGDDDRFKAQLESYSTFESANTVSLPPVLGTSVEQSAIPQVEAEDAPDATHHLDQLDGTTTAYDPTTYIDETQLAFAALGSQLLTSSLRLPYSPPDQRYVATSQLALPEGSQHHEDSVSETGCLGHYQLSLSSYMRSPDLERSAKRRRFEDGRPPPSHDSRTSFPSFVPIREETRLETGSVGAHKEDDDRRNKLINQNTQTAVEDSHDFSAGYETTSELPTSYSLSDINSGSSRAYQLSVQRSVSDPGPAPSPSKPGSTKGDKIGLSSQHPLSQQSNDDADQVESQRRRHDCGETDVVVRTPQVKSYEVLSPEPVLFDAELFETFQNLPEMIRPASPKATLDNFQTHITETLQSLANTPQLKECLDRISVSRRIDSFERGHWLIDITSWSLELQIGFWQALMMHVGDGSAGWGVWCTRELASDRQDAQMRSNREEADLGTSAHKTLGRSVCLVKVYCWGEIAKHVYLLLYIASRSQVRKVGPKWVDAEGIPVIHLRSAG